MTKQEVIDKIQNYVSNKTKRNSITPKKLSDVLNSIVSFSEKILIDLNNIHKPTNTNLNVTGAKNLDFDTYDSYRLELTGNTTLSITYSNTNKQSIVKTITVTSNGSTLTLPSSWNLYGEFDPNKRNKIAVEINNFSSSQEIDCFINQPS